MKDAYSHLPTVAAADDKRVRCDAEENHAVAVRLLAESETLHTFSVITTTPNRLAKRVHERMPVIVHPDDYDQWLSPESQAADLKPLLHPFDPEPMREHHVTPQMNNPRFESPVCVEPITF